MLVDPVFVEVENANSSAVGNTETANVQTLGLRDTLMDPVEGARTNRVDVKNLSYPEQECENRENNKAHNLVKMMDPELFKAAISGDFTPISLMNLLQLTPLGDTVMHISARHGHLDFSRSLSTSCPTLITQANSLGETPFHIAAKAGHIQMVSFLIDCVKGSLSSSRDIEVGQAALLQVLRKVNKEGNTVMHEAVNNNRFEVVKLLIREDPQLLSIVNQVGKSPLYMAVEKGELHIVKRILQTVGYSYSGPNGRTALHAAVLHHPSIVVPKRKPGILGLLLAPPIGNQMGGLMDDNGRSPLHYAAVLGLNHVVAVLLKLDRSMAYRLDKMGYSPVHLAIISGRRNTIIALLRYCPDLQDLLDRRCQNVLHIAVKAHRVWVLGYLLRRKGIEGLVNQKDNNGDTPLHLATSCCNPLIVNILVRDKRMDVMALNNSLFTALDIARSQGYKSKEQGLVLATLLHVDRSFWLKFAFSEEIMACGKNHRRLSINWHVDKTSSLLVVATLVATVTFAAGLTLPGGLQSEGVNQGMATFVRHPMFQEFMLSNTRAMYISTWAVVLIIWLQIFRHFPFFIYHTAQVLTILAMAFMSDAFRLGILLTISENEILSRSVNETRFTFYLISAAVSFILFQFGTPFFYMFTTYIYWRSWLNCFSRVVNREVEFLSLSCYKDKE